MSGRPRPKPSERTPAVGDGFALGQRPSWFEVLGPRPTELECPATFGAQAKGHGNRGDPPPRGGTTKPTKKGSQHRETHSPVPCSGNPSAMVFGFAGSFWLVFIGFDMLGFFVGRRSWPEDERGHNTFNKAPKGAQKLQTTCRGYRAPVAVFIVPVRGQFVKVL